MPAKTIDPSTVRFFATIENVALKFENDLKATGRYKYLRTEGNRKIYVEIATGHEVPVLMPKFAQPKQVS